MITILAAAFLLAGSALTLTASIGLVRFPDLFTRMHAATKPQSLGLLLILVGIGLRLQDVRVIGILALIALFQLLTAPVSAHMVGRAAFRTGRIRQDLLVVDELSDRMDEEH